MITSACVDVKISIAHLCRRVLSLLSMPNTFRLLLLSCLTFGGVAHANDFDRIKTAYENAVKRATDPLKATYQQELQRSTQAGKLDEAAKVMAEIKTLTQTAEPVTPLETGITDAERYFVNKTWKVNSGTLFKFERDGKGTRTFGQTIRPFVWKLAEEGIVEVTGQPTGSTNTQTLFFRFEGERIGFFGENRGEVKAPMERR